MITIQLIGGAKKLFGSSQITLDEPQVVIAELLARLHGMQSAGTPKIDPRNILVAINGVDTSAINGADSTARDGDVVSIIPVVHGGSTPSVEDDSRRVLFDIGRRHVQIIEVQEGAVYGAEFLDDLRGRHKKLTLQAVSGKFVLGTSHAKKILRLSIESERRGILLSNKLEMDILMRFALTRQISMAIKCAGMHKGAFLLIAIGPARSLDLLYDELVAKVTTVPFATDITESLKRRFHITKRHLDATSSDTPLEDILVEKAAVLSIT